MVDHGWSQRWVKHLGVNCLLFQLEVAWSSKATGATGMIIWVVADRALQPLEVLALDFFWTMVILMLIDNDHDCSHDQLWLYNPHRDIPTIDPY